MSSELQNKIVIDSGARTEQALSHAILTTQMETSPDGILVADEHARIISFNQRFVKMWGLPADLVASRDNEPVLKRVTSQIADEEAFLARVRYLYDHKKEKSHEEILLKDGRVFERYSAPMLSPEGRYYGRVWFFRDITGRKRAEEELRWSETQLKVVLESTADGILAVDNKGKVIKTNRRFAELWRIPLPLEDAGDDAVLLDFAIQQLSDPAAFSKKVQSLYVSDAVDMDTLGFKDGRVFERYSFPMLNNGVITGRVWSFRDITKRMQAEAAVRQSEPRFQTLADTSPVGIFRTDAQGQTTYVNPQWCQIAGLSEADALGHGWLRAVHPEDREKLAQGWQGATQAQDASKADYRLVRPDGTISWVMGLAVPEKDDAGHVAGYVGTITDITERKQAEEKLKLFRALIENSSDAIHVVDSATGRFLDVNESACRVLGCTRAEHLALTVFDVVVGVDRALFDATLARAKETGHATAEVQHRRKDGTTYSVEVSLSPITLDREYLVAIVRDVTERKRAEQLLQFNAQEGWTGRHEDYFARLVELIGQTAGVDYAFIGRIKDAQTVQTTGLYAKGKIAPDIEYSTRGAPCHNVIGKTLCHYGEKLQELFPDDALLAEMGAQSYLGIPLMDSSGKPLGLMAVLDTKPMPDARSATALLQIAAVRVAGELERIAAEEALRESEKRYHGLFEHMVEGFAYCRMIFENGEPKDWIYLSVNSVFEKLTGLKGVAGKRVSEVIPGLAKTDPELFKCYARVSLTGEPERIEIFVEALQQWFDISVYSPEKEFFVAVFDVITQRKLAEAALRASEQEFRTLAEAMPQIVWATRPDGWNIYFNQHWVDYTGLTLEESYGRGWNKPFHPDDRQRAWDAWQNATQNDATYSLECRLRRADGAYRWWLIRGEPLRDTDGKILKWFGTCTDIEDIKQAEVALRDSEAFLNTVIEKIPHMIFVKDAKELRFVKFNQAGQDLLGYSLAELAGKNDHDLFPKEQADYFAENDRKVLRGREVVDIPEEPVQTRDKGERILHTKKIPVFDNAGQLTYLLGISEDITEHKRAEGFQARLATAVEQAAETIVITDTKGTILYANPAFEKSSGYTRAEALGQNPRILKSGKQDAEFYRRMWEVLGRGEIWSGHFINRRKDGAFYEEEATISPVRNVAGTIVNYVAVKRDVTREIQLEAQFHQSQKMEAVGQLAGGVAHDFNNILGVIMGYGDLITAGLDPDDPLRKYAEEIRSAAERAAGLTRQLLVFSRKQKVQPVVLDLNGTVKDLDKMLRRLIGENIEMMIVPGNEVGRIKADAGYVGQVLMNLAINARDAMPNGGKLTIATNNVTLDENYTRTHMGVIPGDYVMLSVSDTGTGMTEEVKARMFEPLFTTKLAGKGTGLGLATCQTIVQQSGGHIGVYSEVGKGTTFKIYFPRVDKPLDNASGPIQDGPLPRGTETLLVVEDEPSVRHLAWKVLEALGYHVLRATNGQDGLHLAREHKGSPIRLVVTDVMMPKMDGKVMAEWLKATYPDLKVLFTSGYTDDVIAQHGVLEPGVAFLSKPYTPATLARKVRAMLDNETDTSIVRKRCLTIEQSPPGFA